MRPQSLMRKNASLTGGWAMQVRQQSCMTCRIFSQQQRIWDVGCGCRDWRVQELGTAIPLCSSWMQRRAAVANGKISSANFTHMLWEKKNTYHNAHARLHAECWLYKQSCTVLTVKTVLPCVLWHMLAGSPKGVPEMLPKVSQKCQCVITVHRQRTQT